MLNKLSFHAVFWAHIILLCGVFLTISIPLSPDEAHYYLWSKNLDWSFYSKGPLIALVIRLSTDLFGYNEHAVRLPTLFFSLGTASLIFNYLKNNFKVKHAILLYLSIFSSASLWYQSLIMTTDALVVFCWVASGLLFKKYLDQAELGTKSLMTLGIGCLILGLGIWSKYTIFILLLTFFIFLVRTKAEVSNKIKSYFILTLLILIFIAPLVIWNYQHGWVNFVHNAGHLGAGKQVSFRPLYFLDFLGGQLGVFGLFIVPLFILTPRIFKIKKSRGAQFLIYSGLLLFLTCALVSFFKKIYPNWSMPAYPVFMFIMGTSLVELYERKRRAYLGMLFVNILVTFFGILLLYGFTFGLPGKRLPTKKLIGWPQFSESILAAKNKHPDIPIIMTDSYDYASELGFYAPELSVYNVPVAGRRMSQFDIWQKGQYFLKNLKGKDILLVLSNQEVLKELESRFFSVEHVEPAPYFNVNYSGASLRNVYVYVGRGYSGEEFIEPLKR